MLIGTINDSWEFACCHGIDHQSVIGTMKSLLADAYVVESVKTVEIWQLSAEGKKVASEGSPEFQVLFSIDNERINNRRDTALFNSASRKRHSYE